MRYLEPGNYYGIDRNSSTEAAPRHSWPPILSISTFRCTSTWCKACHYRCVTWGNGIIRGASTCWSSSAWPRPASKG
jgi:hypothetical protein